jgi:hypothetical protein
MSKSTVVSLPQAGFPISAWCAATNISRAHYYNLPPELQPSSVKIGKRHIVIEPPQDYLRRVHLLAAKAA